MWRLAWKDLCLNVSAILSILAIVALLYVLSYVLGSATVAAMTLTCMGTYALFLAPTLALAYAGKEEKYRTLGFLRILPIPAWEIAASPYFVVLAITVAAALLFSLLARFNPAVGNPASALRYASPPSYFLAMACTLPISGLALAVFFKAGLQEAQIAAAGVTIAFIAGLGALAWKLGIGVEEVFDWVYNPPLAAVVFIGLVCLAVYALEFWLARWFFERREI